MTRVADLRLRLTLLRPLLADDGAGGSATSFATVAEVWGAARPSAVAERIVSDRLDGVVTHTLRLRFRDDIAGGWRLVAGARVFRALAARDPDGRRRWLDVLAEEEGR